MADTHEALVQKLIDEGTLRTERIINAFKETDRKDFVPADRVMHAYADHPLPIGNGQTISQPTTVAIMLELLAPGQGQDVLDIGSGSGWTTTLLARIVGSNGSVLGLEVVPELVKQGQENLAGEELPQARIEQASDQLGRPREQFERILVSAAARSTPEELFEQLREGGAMVLPVQNRIEHHRKVKGHIQTETIHGFSFVPLKH